MQKKLIILTFVLIMLTTFAYSALATNLSITGEANFRAISDIRINNIVFDSVENGATLSYEPSFTKDTITSGFVLPSANSSISYNVTIKNKGTIDQAIYNLQTLSSNNNDMIILIDNKPINEALPMIVPFGTSKTIKITYKTTSPSSNVINIINKFIFKEVYYITYNLKGGTSTNNQTDLTNGQVKYHDVDLTLTEERPIKNKYVFSGWTDEQNGTTVKYSPGSTYTLNENKTLYAVYRQGEATFVSGTEFNSKIKQLAGNVNATYETTDSNITSIVRANNVPSAWIVNGTITPPSSINIVSTSTSDFPIYAWYDNGTIYYYTLVDNPYMNSNSSNMFRGITNVTSIAINTIDTSRSTNMDSLFHNCNSLSNINLSNFSTVLVSSMDSMFQGCSSLTSLTLSSFNTSNVLSMQSMFNGCSSIAALNLSDFTTSNVTNTESMFENCTSLANLTISSFATTSLTNSTQMFKNCSSLTSLDLSNFNLSSVTSIIDILNGMTALRQLKTPRVYPSNLSITLPNTFYSANNTSYTTLATGSPTQTWIKLPYTVKFDSNNGTGTMSNQKIGVDATTKLTDNTFTRVGYTFVGWNTQANGQGTAYLDKASVTNLGTFNDEITLYAQWIGNTYTVTFDYNDGITSSTTKQVTYDSEYGTLPEPVRDGYTFDGWNGKNMFDKTKYSKMEDYDITNNHTFYYATIQLKPNTNYKVSVKRYNEFNGMNNGYLLISTINQNGIFNDSNNWSSIAHPNNPNGSPAKYSYTTDSTGNLYIGRYNVTQNNLDTIWENTDVMIEEGSSATPYEPYYVTSSTTVTQAKDHTLKAIWEKKEATFDTGQNFNAKIKKLSGTNDATYSTTNTNITSIQRANSLPSSWIVNDVLTPPSDNNIVSTNDSPYPIYAWFNNGTIYYYTEALNPYMNTTGTNMFSNLRGLTNSNSLDISSIDTSKTTTMNYMFSNCQSLLELDLSNFKTSKVDSTAYMFYNSGLKTLDLSSFDLSSVNPDSMLIGMESLQSLKTPNTYPSDTSITISLPTTLYDNSGNSYSTLTSTSPTSSWLRKNYTIIFNKNDSAATGTMSNQQMTYGTSTNLTANTFSKTGYIFAGWNTKADGSGILYKDKQSVTSINTNDNGQVTLYAQWVDKLWAENIYHENSELNCEDAQCVIDELYYMLY